jgi:NADH-quinone oxidoreductase subunit M
MNDPHIPWLALAVLLPLVGAARISAVREADKARNWSIGFAAAALACSVAAWLELVWFGPQIAPYWSPLARVFGFELLAIDQLSAPLLPLAALLFLLTAVATLRTKVRRFSFAWMLVSEAIVLATLACRTPWGVIALLAVGTLPPYFELRARRKPTRVYVVHMAAFAALMILGGVLVAVQSADDLVPAWAVAPLAVGLLIRCGVAPLHCWASDLFEHASFGTALLFVTPMLGEYGVMRLILPVAPPEVLRTIAIAALATAVYAAGMALVQREARRFFCYLYLSHSALVLVGLDSGTVLGLTGGLCVWLSIGLSLAGLGLTLRALESRHGRISLAAYHGVYEHTPALAICFLLTGMASVGFPGTFGFLGGELLIEGAVEAFPLIGIAVVLAAAINGIAVLQAYFQLFTGTRHISSVPLAIGLREKVAVLTLAVLILGGGLFPQPGVASRHQAAETILQDRRLLADKDEPPERPAAVAQAAANPDSP